MAAFVKRASATYVTANSSATLVIPFTSAPAATTNTIVCEFATNQVLTAAAVADSQGGPYVIDKTDFDGGATHVYIVRRTTALSTGSIVTITITGAAGSFWSGNACEYSGVATGNITTGTSGAGTTQPFSAVTSAALVAGDLVVAIAEADDNVNPQGLADPCTGGTGTWTSRGSQQNTTASTCSAFADKVNGIGGAETATWAVTNPTTGRIGIIVGYSSAGAGGAVQQQLMMMGIGS